MHLFLDDLEIIIFRINHGVHKKNLIIKKKIIIIKSSKFNEILTSKSIKTNIALNLLN